MTDENGTYRFPALPPGDYEVTAELSGFKTTSQQARLQLGQIITLDAKLEVGGLTDRVTVVGGAPVVDVKSSSSQKNLDTEILENIPFGSRFGPDAIALSPGVNPNTLSSYGSGGSSGNSYMIDGVDVGDPEVRDGLAVRQLQLDPGSAGHRPRRERRVRRLHGRRVQQPVPIGQQQVPRACSKRCTRTTSCTDSNTNAEILEANPDLKSGTTDYVTDSTFQIGGPIKTDKLWFFTSFQYYRPKTAPSGYPPTPPDGYTNLGIGPQSRLEKSPRFLFKPTLKLGQSDQLTGFFEADSYTVDGRGAGATVDPAATLHQDSPEFSWNANYSKVLSLVGDLRRQVLGLLGLLLPDAL